VGKIGNIMQLRKWRPTHKCLYVIPEVLGNAEKLQCLFDRILPLRVHSGQEDVLVLLGDYVGGGSQSKDVLDLLIAAKKECGDRLMLLRGGNDDLMLKAIEGGQDNITDWNNAGAADILASYGAAGEIVSKSLLRQVIPQEHIDLLRSLEHFAIIDEFFFMHGSFDPKKRVAENTVQSFVYDSSASRYTKECLLRGAEPKFLDDFIFVSSHNFNGKEPFIYRRYMMLGGLAPKKLFAIDLNSMEARTTSKGKERLRSYELKVVE
jgi:calcineurin-like phosphoesterase family protein